MKKYKKSILISDQENIKLDEYFSCAAEPEHTHDYFELVYIEGGSGTHRVDDVEYKVEHGDLIFMNCNQRHSYESETGMKLVNFFITPEFISNELIDAESITELFRHSMFAEFNMEELPLKQCVSFSGIERKETDALTGMMVREYNQKSPGYKSVLQGGVRILFSKILRYMHTDIATDSRENEALFEDIMSYINENYNHKISLAEIAARSFYNPVYFGNMLKKYCGKSFSAYLKEKRLNEASELLKTTDLSVTEVMERVGYSDKKLFYAHFKEMFGNTPGKYR